MKFEIETRPNPNPSGVIDLAKEFDLCVVFNHRPDVLLPIVVVRSVNLGGDLQFQA